MSKISIIREDNMVVVDGRGINVDCQSLAAAIHAVQWDGDAGVGHIEFVNPPGTPPDQYLLNQTINSQADFDAKFGTIVAAWHTAANLIDNPPPPTLAQVKAIKTQQLRAAAAQASVADFKSSALGAVYSYPCDELSQQNLIASVTASLIPGLPSNWTTPFWCADINGVWAFREHTAAQIQQVGQDGKQHIVDNQRKLAALQPQVDAATTVAAVNAITW
jgi:hypothetical protein